MSKNKILYDYHIHTEYSHDSVSKLEDVVQYSISKNLKEIAITNHINPIPSSGVLFDTNFRNHLDDIKEMQLKYNKQIKILKGVEITLFPDNEKEYNDFLNKYNDLDFIIGSTHSLNKLDIATELNFLNFTKKQSYEMYLEEILYCIPKFNYNVHGHLDFISRYSGYENPHMLYKDFSDLIDEIFKSLIKHNKGLEVNTSGFRYGVDYFYPSKDILKRYKELGGEIITVGSDGHTIKNIALDFDIAYDYLKECGFDYITTFDKLNPKQIKI